MTKSQMYRRLSAMDRGISFIANVIYCWHSNPARKLRNLLKLIDAGHEIGTGNDIDQISIDGRIQSLSVLN